MPLAAKRICAAPGCSALVEKGRCARCAPAFNARNGTTSQRGYDGDWRRVRACFLRQRCNDCGDRPVVTCMQCRGSGLANRFCAECLGEGVFVAARQVDHVLGFEDKSLRLDVRNLQGICETHHSQKTRAEQYGEEPSEFQMRQRERVTALLAKGRPERVYAR